jgi:mitochondrial chaperone BCS1
MYPEIKKLIGEVMVTPAEVAEVLMRNDDADAALHDLVDVLKSKLNDNNVIKTEHSSANNQQDEDQEHGDDY